MMQVHKRAIRHWKELRAKLILVVALKIGHRQVVSGGDEDETNVKK